MAEKLVAPSDLAALAKIQRETAGKTRADAARELGVAQPTIFFAEEEPERGLHKLRMEMIERYSDLEVVGPLYLIRNRQGHAA